MKIKLIKPKEITTSLKHKRIKKYLNKLYIRNIKMNKVLLTPSMSQTELDIINDFLIRDCYFEAIPIVCGSASHWAILLDKMEKFVRLMNQNASELVQNSLITFYSNLILPMDNFNFNKTEYRYVLVHPSCDISILSKLNAVIYNGFAHTNRVSKII